MQISRKRLLSILFPPYVPLHFGLHDHVSNISYLSPRMIGQYAATTYNKWTSILHLASKWGFTDVRSLATRKVFVKPAPDFDHALPIGMNSKHPPKPPRGEYRPI